MIQSMDCPGLASVPNIVNTVVFSPGSVTRPNILAGLEQLGKTCEM